MELDENILADIRAVIGTICTHFILKEDEVGYETEVWENGRMNLMIIIPSRISSKICKPCVGVHFSQWFRDRYPESIISHISFMDHTTSEQQETKL